MFPFFYKFRENLSLIFSIRNIILQIIACLITYIIVVSGFDWFYFKFAQVSSLTQYFSPAIFLGGLIPIFGLPIFYIIARQIKHKNLLVITWALAQSAVLAWIISAVYKAFTGRIQPPHSVLIDTSRQWNFGFLKHGIFWGWPSSHTIVAFAMSFTLISLYPKRKDIFYVGIIYALYIGIGVSTRIHWFSEFVAGAIIGAIIGAVVGKSFQTKLISKL